MTAGERFLLSMKKRLFSFGSYCTVWNVPLQYGERIRRLRSRCTCFFFSYAGRLQADRRAYRA